MLHEIYIFSRVFISVVFTTVCRLIWANSLTNGIETLAAPGDACGLRSRFLRTRILSRILKICRCGLFSDY